MSSAIGDVLTGRTGEVGRRGATAIWAVRDLTFELKHGEPLGIIGNNGAGKTTLLKVLARITAPTEGKVRMRGRVGSLLEVGTGFHMELTGRENVFLNGAVLGMRRKLPVFDDIVDFSGVEEFMETPLKFYSSGMDETGIRSRTWSRIRSMRSWPATSPSRTSASTRW
jgi:lipopolysaccharide transport system ATP-binding protein